jgi:tetratricopeptide (TPR) repeat protein
MDRFPAPGRVVVPAAFIVGAALFFAACASAPEVTDQTTPAEIIQRAQEASDRNRYGLALQYYQILLDRSADDLELVCTAEYEIAFIHYKQKKYAEARSGLDRLLARYNSSDAELLPRQFKRLGIIVLERITEKEQAKTPFDGIMSLFRKKEPQEAPPRS